MWTGITSVEMQLKHVPKTRSGLQDRGFVKVCFVGFLCIVVSFAIRLSQKLLCKCSHWLRSQDSGVWSHGVIFVCHVVIYECFGPEGILQYL